MTGEQVFLVQGREDGLWGVCDPAQYFYNCKSPGMDGRLVPNRRQWELLLRRLVNSFFIVPTTTNDKETSEARRRPKEKLLGKQTTSN